MKLDIGTLVGDYEITGTLGAGGMGKVFKVRNTISDRIEAMKIVLPDLSGEPDLADRFLREIKVQASLDHPNIAGLRTAFRFENQLLMVMELVEGVNLDQYLHQGPMPVDKAVDCISQVLAALSYAHGKGVVHRDIKPANMMLMSNGTVKLMDFGIAKSSVDRKLTMTGATIGSLYYMSPEQIRGSQTLDARSDLYSVGVSLYELVTGKRPFDGDSQFAIMSAHLEKTPVPPVVIDPKLPPALNDLILLSVQREAADRFQSAAAFRNALAGAMSGIPKTEPAPVGLPDSGPVVKPVAVASPPPASATAPAKSHRALWATVGGLCAVGALAAMIQFGPWKKTAAGNPPATIPPVSSSTTPPVVATPTPAPVTEPVAATPTATPTAGPAAGKPLSSATSSSTQRPAVKQTASQQQAPPQTIPQPQTTPPQSAAQPSNPPAAQPAGVQPNQSAQRAELMKQREGMATLAARASSIHSALDNLRRAQAASGLGLRGDWLTSASLMDSFLTGSNDALAAGDIAAAKDYMEKAERQIDKLEKALGR